MKHWRIVFPLLFLLSPVFWKGAGNEAVAQRSKHGAKVVATANNIVNEYTALTANAAAGATTITVANSALNANNRFGVGNNLAAGDLIMIIQMQGATINGSPDPGNANLGVPADSTWGAVLNYNDCGNWEFAEVNAVPNATSITLSCPLTYSYTVTGKTQVIRVPRYSTLTVNSGGIITCDTWNGTIGGVCAIEVEFNSAINAGGSINTTGKGFRGGVLENQTNWSVAWITASKLAVDGAEKGESVAGYQADYDPYGGRYCKGAPANGGGGGNAQNAGGGGGANGGNPALWNGHGNPDISTAAYINAWELEYSGLSTQTSSGGGKGGYTFSANNVDPTQPGNGPGNFAVWGGDWRYAAGGFGGRPLNYGLGKLFLGGGGGAGDMNNNEGGAGGIGGGMIYLMNYGLVTGTGQLVSNGNNGANTTGALTSSNHRDGAGGGGGGGTIVLNSVGAITGVSLTANGGNGGNQLITSSQAEGPGGGGGGGYIAVSNGTPAMNVNGGNNGTTNSSGVNEFPPNGATKGGAGSSGAVLMTNIVLNSPNVTICAGQAATLTASIGGNPPPGTTVTWYDALVGGNVLGTGTTLTTSVIPTPGTYTFYIGSCPGTYHQPVVVTATNAPVITVSPNTTICSGDNTTLDASGGTSYSWSPATGLSNPNISNPVADPTATTTYSVTVNTPCGQATGTVMVTVNSSITANISGNTSICAGGSTTLTASGGATYSWSTGSTNTDITVSPTNSTTYSVTATNGSCTSSTSITVNVTSAITASVTASSTTICPGSSVTLTGSGGNNYSWNTGATTASITDTPTSTTTYSVDVASGSCTSSASVTITISNNLAATINGPTNICAGGSATLAASGGGTYQWSTSQTSSAITVTPTGTSTYSVLVSAGTCTASASHTVNVGANITANISGPATICGGSSATLSASGGSNYAWNTGASTANISVAPAPSTTATYSVIVSSGSCADTATISVSALPSLFAYISGSTVVCQGSSSTLSASMNNPNNNSYIWSTGSTATTITISPTVTTTYSVVGFSGSCSDTVPYTVSVIPQASATVSSSTTICAGQSAVLSASGGTSYSWSNGSPNSSITVSPLLNSTYTVIAGIGACSDTDSVAVTVLPSPTVAITSTNNTICSGDVVTLNAAGGTNYTWSNGSTSSSITVTPASTTTYSVITSNSSCNDTATVTITVSPPPPASINGNNNICQGQTVTLSAGPAGATYSWSTGQTTQTINPATPGNYSVVVSIGTCKDTAYVTTVIAPNPTAIALADTTIIGGTSASLSASGGTSFVWDNAMTGASISVSPNSTTVYCVTVYDNNNCIDTACVTVKVENCGKVLYLPNAFSPNGDLENDEWQIYYNIPECIEKFKLVVYNRWGEQVYHTTNPRFKWDGSYKGWFFGRETGGTEVYTYYMKAVLIDGTDFSKRGNVSLLR